jgi:hypothetical protein
MAFAIPWSAAHPSSGQVFVGLATCGGCGLPTSFHAYSGVTTSPPHNAQSDIESAKYEVRGFWPASKGPEIPRHLPPDFKAKLLEAEKSFAAQINTGAAGLYRSLIDATTKRQLTEAELKSAGTLQARIDRLAEKHVIPDTVAAWAHEVRVIANDGLHDEPTVSREDAEMARSFALTYLRYNFELPGDVAARRTIKVEGTAAALA